MPKTFEFAAYIWGMAHYEETKPRRDVRRELAEALMERIESRTAPWQMPWDPSQGDDSPVNAVTGKTYRGINRLLLTIYQPDSDPRWCTFKQAQERGWKIIKGSHGVTIEKWVTVEKADKADRGENSFTTGEGNEKHLVPRYYTVFHATQIEGIPELEPKEQIVTTPMPEDRIASIATTMQIKLDHGGNMAYYQLSSDSIRMPLRSSFATLAGYDTVLLHEIGHATGHKSRLNRTMSGSFGSSEYAKEELRAEISAAMNARVLGISFNPDLVDRAERSGIDNSAAYLGSWLSVLPEEDRKTELMAAISSAQKISDYVLEFALPLKEDLDKDLTPESDRRVSLAARVRL